MMPRALIKAFALFILLLGQSLSATVTDPSDVDALISEAGKYLYSTPEKSVVLLENLKDRQSTFTPSQKEKFQLIYASSLGFRGKHEERAALVQSVLERVRAPVMRAKFLYEMVDATTALGRYEEALRSMNEAILLLPLLESPRQEMTVLKSAITLLSSLRAYDEALSFAERIYTQGANTPGSYALCVGLADKVEINFLRGNSAHARALAPEAVRACDCQQK